MDAFSRSVGHSRGINSSRSQSATSGNSATVTKQSGGSVTYSPTLQPVYDWLEQVSSVTYYQPNEQQFNMQQRQANLPVGQCHAVVAGLGVARMIFPKPADVVAAIGPEVHDRLDGFVSELLLRPSYVDPAAIDGAYLRLIHRNRDGWNTPLSDPGNDPFSQ